MGNSNVAQRVTDTVNILIISDLSGISHNKQRPCAASLHLVVTSAVSQGQSRPPLAPLRGWKGCWLVALLGAAEFLPGCITPFVSYSFQCNIMDATCYAVSP